MYTALFTVTSLFLLLTTLVGLFLFMRVRRERFITVLVFSLLFVTFLLVVIQIIAWQSGILTRFQAWVFKLDEDRNAPAIFAAVQWAIIGLLMIAIGFQPTISRWQRLYWWGMALVFFWVSIDDYYAIHEYIFYSWRRQYKLLAALLGTISLVAFWTWFRHQFRARLYPFIMIFLGAVIVVISGLWLEKFLYNACDEAVPAFFCDTWRQTTSLEEIFELMGATITIAGLLLYAQAQLPESLWHYTRRVLTRSSLILTLVLIGYMWPMPLLEAQFLATPVSVEYENGALSLLGYWTPNKVLEPGERAYIFLYWKANTPPDQNYRLSVHLVAQPDVEDIGQADSYHLGQLPSSEWPVNTVIRKAVYIDTPEDLPTPASYWIVVTVRDESWKDTGYDPITIPITESDQPVLGDDNVIVGSIPALSHDDLPEPAITTQYQFMEGFTLSGYDLPETAELGKELIMHWWWDTNTAIDTSMTQFVHLFQCEGDAYTVFDQQPFEGTFPTEDWPDNIQVMDEWTLQLPDDVPPGEYEVHTGLVDLNTHDRIAVTDDGQPVQDYSITLGTITLTEDHF